MNHAPFFREGTGPNAVLLIHGIAGSPAHFRDLVSVIPEGFSVYNILLDGHSGPVDNLGRSSMAKWKAQVAATLEALFARYCTLAAIGTVADVMLMADENRTIVSRGLESIDHSDFIGLHALLREAGLADRAVTSVQIGFVLAPRINAAGRMGAATCRRDTRVTQQI